MKGLDHLVLAVDDLDAAVEQYKALGFTVTPRAKHPFGTHNCLIQLDGFFLEVLTIGEPDKVSAPAEGTFSFPNFNQTFLADQQGPSMLVLDTDDFRDDFTQAQNDGLQTWPVFEFSRQTTLPDGGEATVSFGLNFVSDAQIPNAAFFTCQQFAPQYFWKKHYQTHSNTAVNIAEICLVAEDPSKHVSFLSKFAQLAEPQSQGESVTIKTARGNIHCTTPSQFADRYKTEQPQLSNGPQICGFTISVDDKTKAPQNPINICGATILFEPKA